MKRTKKRKTKEPVTKIPTNMGLDKILAKIDRAIKILENRR
jgi:hypothetical protein